MLYASAFGSWPCAVVPFVFKFIGTSARLGRYMRVADTLPACGSGTHRDLYEPDYLPEERSKEKIKGFSMGDWSGVNASWGSIAR